MKEKKNIKLTFTLDEELANELDKLIDEKLLDKSKVLEKLVNDYLSIQKQTLNISNNSSYLYLDSMDKPIRGLKELDERLTHLEKYVEKLGEGKNFNIT